MDSVLTGCLIVLVLTPWLILILPSDEPNARKVHTVQIPRGGGIAVCAGLALGAWTLPWRWAVPLAIIFLVGVVDDIRGMSAWTKLFWQTIAAGLFVGDWTWTVLWIVLLTNSWNLIDGVDGLASGLGIVTAILSSILLMLIGSFLESRILLALTGALLGFLLFNWPPAKVFLGDSGSLLIGFVLAAATLSLDWPLRCGVMAVPFYDTALAILRRGRRFWLADRQHLHHQLLDTGFSPRLVSLTLILVHVYVVAGVMLP